jgi:hypothetical protein
MAKDKSTKIQANIATSPIASSHTPQPKKRRPSNSPNPSFSGKIKKAWRASGTNLSLRQFARKNDMGHGWLANKIAFR